MKIAILHETLLKRWSAENTLNTVLWIFPTADLYTLLYDKNYFWGNIKIENLKPCCHKLLTQRIFNIFKKPWLSYLFMPLSVKGLDFSNYDIVFVNSNSFGHWLKTNSKTKTIIYYHSPRNFLSINHGFSLYNFLLKRLKNWEYKVAQKNDLILVDSYTTQKFIKDNFRLNSNILFPPISLEAIKYKTEKNTDSNYYLIVSDLKKEKNIEIAIHLFNSFSNLKLKIIWDGNYQEELKSMSWKNIEFLWSIFWLDLKQVIWNSLGLIYTWREDFSLFPVEVTFFGKPIFAFKDGGLSEIIINGITGDFFLHEDGADFETKFTKFHQKNISLIYNQKLPKTYRVKFSKANFEKEIKALPIFDGIKTTNPKIKNEDRKIFDLSIKFSEINGYFFKIIDNLKDACKSFFEYSYIMMRQTYKNINIIFWKIINNFNFDTSFLFLTVNIIMFMSILGFILYVLLRL